MTEIVEIIKIIFLLITYFIWYIYKRIVCRKFYMRFQRKCSKFVKTERDYHLFVVPLTMNFITRCSVEYDVYSITPTDMAKTCFTFYVVTWFFSKIRRDLSKFKN